MDYHLYILNVVPDLDQICRELTIQNSGLVSLFEMVFEVNYPMWYHLHRWGVHVAVPTSGHPSRFRWCMHAMITIRCGSTRYGANGGAHVATPTS